MLPVHFYGETEFWFASLKVFMMIGLLILSFILFWAVVVSQFPLEPFFGANTLNSQTTWYPRLPQLEKPRSNQHLAPTRRNWPLHRLRRSCSPFRLPFHVRPRTPRCDRWRDEKPAPQPPQSRKKVFLPPGIFLHRLRPLNWHHRPLQRRAPHQRRRRRQILRLRRRYRGRGYLRSRIRHKRCDHKRPPGRPATPSSTCPLAPFTPWP